VLYPRLAFFLGYRLLYSLILLLPSTDIQDVGDGLVVEDFKFLLISGAQGK
jgi:hypothetical protein